MKAVYGLYPDGQSAQQAVNRLRAAGLADREITVISSQPMEDYEFSHMDRAKSTWIWWLACLGGLIGMSVGLALSWHTATAWPMNVGGLPTFAWWPMLIILFEMTMLGAILATVVTLVVSALIPRKGQTLYDPEVTDGKILVGVENPAGETVPALETALSGPSGALVKTV